jgi:serine/threonine protein kinase/tetratricopeptide (TPR) repeat protein
MIGEQILHYKILKKLGEGGMGVVYLAEDLHLERKVAIKFLPHHITAGIEDIERFKVEAKAAASLSHPNITTIHAIEESSDQTFIVMEYIEGIELSDKIKSGPCSIEDVVSISLKIGQALEAAHKKGIVHRDIKSQNIMITGEGNVKIMDFGVAKIGKSSQTTKSGVTVGTLGYIPPEQIRGAEADARSDIFSFGVVMYEMLTGHLPFDAEYEAATFHLILNEPPKPIENCGSDVPEKLCTIIRRSLEKDPDNRYQSVSELLTDLYPLQEPGIIDTDTQLKVNTRAGISLKNPVRVLTGILVLVIIFSSYFLFFNKSENVKPPSQELKSLAVMYFENLPDPKDKHHVAEMLTNLLITALSQTNGLEVISREQLYKTLEDLDLSDSKVITKKTAMKIARSAGISTIVVGSILKDVPSLSVTTKLIDVNSGHILGSQRLAGFGSEEIFSFVDSLSLLVRNDLRIAGIDSVKTKPVADVTTDSPEAYRAYVEGFNASNKLYFKDAAAAFKKAIELDSSFAMAYYYLAKTLVDPSEKRSLIKKAVELSDNVTEREKLLIYALNYSMQANRKQAAEIYRKIIEKYPHETEAYNHLADISDVGVNVFRRGVQVNPSSKILWDNLAISYAMDNRKQEALDAANEYLKLAPAEPNPYDTKGEICALFMEYDSSEIYFKKALEFRKDFWNVTMKLGNLEVLKGNFDEAKKYFDMTGGPGYTYPSVNVYHGLLNAEIKRLENGLLTITDTWKEAYTRAILIHLYYETGKFTEMLQMARESINKWKKIFPHDHYGRSLLVWALVKNNRSAEAETIIDNMLKEKDESFPWVGIHALMGSSVLSYEEGDYQLALDKFNETFSKVRPLHEPHIFQAICLVKTGRLKDAEAEFIRIKNWPMTDLCFSLHFVPGGVFYGYIYNVKAHYWLGVTYEKLGEKDKAKREYKTFLDIWKDADFNSPELSDAKIRLAKLE